MAAKLMGGWRVSGIYSYRTSFPVNVTAPATACHSATNNECRLNVVDIKNTMTDSNGVDTPRFNRAAFQIQTFAFGNAAPNILRGNVFNNWDLAISKDFLWSDRYRIEFRFEMFNAFNHPQFGDPVASVGSRFLAGPLARLSPVTCSSD